MKREKITTGIQAVVLSVALAASSLLCLSTGFQLEPFDVGDFLAFVVLVSLTGAVLANIPRGGLILAGTLALGSGFLLRQGSFMLQLEALVQQVTHLYFNAYGFRVITWSGTALEGVAVDLPLAVGAMVIALVAVWAICRGKGISLAISLSLLPIILCMVVTDTVPATEMLFLYLLTVMVLMMTQTLRRCSQADGNRLTWILLLPLLAAVGALFLFNPRDAYEAPVESPAQQFIAWVQDLVAGEGPLKTEGRTELDAFISGDSMGRVNLGAVGPKTKQTFKVMEVNASQSGTLYLRGQAFGDYDGKTWYPFEDYDTALCWPMERTMEPVGTVHIETVWTCPVLYTPYYSYQEGWERDIPDGRYDNWDDLREYSFYQMETTGTTVSEMLVSSQWNGGNFQKLDPQTLEWARELLNSIGYDPDMDTWDKVALIQGYVLGSAAYSLNTPKMPDSEQDFARWFLTESDTGYCVHFATAATVLLRAAEVPARYVTGYMVFARADRDVRVTAEDAHAWVEYLDPIQGWTMLEVTPSADDEEDENPTQRPTDPAETTRPPQTRPPQTQPPQTTAPGETEPDAPQGPDVPDAPREGPRLGWLWILLGTGLGVAAVIGQWAIRLELRRRQLHRGSPNVRALARWQQVELLSRLLKVPASTELEALANKAKYSQHTLVPQELERFDWHIAQLEGELRKEPWFRKIWLRLVYAAW